MDEADFEAFVDGARERLSGSSEMSTRTTELRVVLPLLKALGWEIHGPEIVVEYGVRPPAGSGGERTNENREEDEGSESAGSDPTGDDADGVEDGPEDADADDGANAGAGTADPPAALTVDYALCLDGEPAVLLATGAAGEPVDRATVGDLEAAMAAAGVDVGLATNGRSYVLLGRRGDDVERVTLDLADLAEDPSPLAHYSRAGARHRRLRERRERRRAVAEELSADREAAVEGVAAAIADEAGADLDGELAAAGEAFVDRVVDALSTGAHPETAVAGRGSDEHGDAPEDGAATDPAEGDPDADEPAGEEDATARNAAGSGTAPERDPAERADPGARSAGAGSAPGRTDDGRTEAKSRSGGDGDVSRGSDGEDASHRSDGEAADVSRESDDGGEYVVRFFDDSASVGAVGHGTPEGAMAQAVEYLFEQRGLDSRLDPPWGPEDTPGRAILNRAPVHPDGTEMTAATQLSNGYFLYTDLPAPATRRVVGSLTRKAGLRAMFQGEWADDGR